MIASLPVALVLTALFAVTGGYALLRWSSAVAGPLPAARRISELAHLLMSVAMLLMIWTWYGSTGLAVQVVVFGGFAAWFAVDAARRHRRRRHGCAGGSAHALMSAAMVWMLVAMPHIMAVPVTTAGSGGHTGHTGHAGHGGAGTAAGAVASGGQDGWAVAVTVLLGAALLGAVGFWATRAVAAGTRGHECDDDVPGVPPARPVPVSAERLRTAATPPPGAVAESTADAPAVTPPRPAAGPPPGTRADAPAVTPPRSAAGPPLGARAGVTSAPVVTPDVTDAPLVNPGRGGYPAGLGALGTRTDAGCHALASLGMVVMLAAMVAGW